MVDSRSICSFELRVDHGLHMHRWVDVNKQKGYMCRYIEIVYCVSDHLFRCRDTHLTQ